MVSLHENACLPILDRARERFFAKVGPETVTGCKEWMGKRDTLGYGTFCSLEISRYLKAHRVAWVLSNGPIPRDRPVIRHSCDNPSCVNPAHLTPGTQTQNVMDAVSRRRNSAGKCERHGKAKLTQSMVSEIRARRAAGDTCASLGREFGVGRDQVSRICNFKVWPATS